jgi:hypothetical protein
MMDKLGIPKEERIDESKIYTKQVIEVHARARRVYQKLRDLQGVNSLIMVSHGGFMVGLRVAIEGWSRADYIRNDTQRDPLDWVHNGLVLEYSRKDPYTDELTEGYSWMRMVCPWNTSLSSNVWRPVANQEGSNCDEYQCEGKLLRSY